MQVDEPRRSRKQSRKTMMPNSIPTPLIQQSLRENITAMVQARLVDQVQRELQKGITGMVSQATHNAPERKQRKLDDIVNCFSQVIKEGPNFAMSQENMIKYESNVSKEIKVLAEVEKMWILYDLDGSGTIEHDECASYLREMSSPTLELSDKEIMDIFCLIDMDGDGQIDKLEMICFLKVLMLMQNNLSFKSSSSFFNHQYEIEKQKQRKEQ